MIAGANLNLVGGGGTNHGGYYLLTSSNLASPFTNWTPIATNTFDGSGNFSTTLPLSTGNQQRFYVIKSQ
jgi:hypothetical protein